MLPTLFQQLIMSCYTTILGFFAHIDIVIIFHLVKLGSYHNIAYTYKKNFKNYVPIFITQHRPTHKTPRE